MESPGRRDPVLPDVGNMAGVPESTQTVTNPKVPSLRLPGVTSDEKRCRFFLVDRLPSSSEGKNFSQGAEPKTKREGSAKPYLVVQFHPAPPSFLSCPHNPCLYDCIWVKQSLESADSPNERHKWPIPGCFWSMTTKLCARA